MILWDELYFEITLEGTRAELDKFVAFLSAGELDEFFEQSEDYVILDDKYDEAEDGESLEVVFTNDGFPIEIEELDADELLEIICKAAKNLEVYGYVADGSSELRFTSAKGDSYYLNARDGVRFNDELDEVASEEEDND